MQTHLKFLSGLLLAASACAGGEENVGRSCEPPGDQALRRAARAYVEDLDPMAHQYLAGVGTDSALPRAAQAGLQEKGRVLMWPADTAQQARVRPQLTASGSYTTALVNFHGMRQDPENERRAEATFSAAYIAGPHDGRSAPRSSVQLRCRNAEWHVLAEEDTTAGS